MVPRTEKQFKKIRQDKTELILNSALKLFADNGYHSTSISQIAKNAKISKGLIYNYFKSKEALLHDIMLRGLKDFTKALVVKDINNIKKQEIINFIDRSLNLLKTNVDFYRLYFSLVQQGIIVSLFEKEMLEIFSEIFNTIAMYYTQKGEKKPYIKTRFLIATIDGIAAHYLLDINNFPINEIRYFVIELI